MTKPTYWALLAASASALGALGCTSIYQSGESYGSTTNVYRNANSAHYDSFPWNDHSRRYDDLVRPSRYYRPYRGR